ncbi:MAG TPA: hypothetical protein VGG03_11240 [Thermoanaerobaculia bacterium]|jgi:hypothetical protein
MREIEMRARTLFAAGLLFACAAAAHGQTVAADKPACLPMQDNGLVRATANAAGPGQALRLYFRWKDHEDFYWVAMEPEANGRFWATPPKPEKRNEQVEYYAALVDPAGQVLARSATQTVKVTGDCRVQLGPRERGVAENLTIGETSPKQQGKKVMAFLCDGIVTRVNSQGVRRADEVCRACVIAWWPKAALAAPAIVGIGVITEHDPPEPSPSRP